MECFLNVLKFHFINYLNIQLFLFIMISYFHSDTKILTDYGLSKPISEIKIGDYVLGIDGKKKKILDVYHDIDDLFLIQSKSNNKNFKDCNYIVNRKHKLSLFNTITNSISYIKVDDFIRFKKRFKLRHYLMKNDKVLEFPFRTHKDAYDFGSDLMKDETAVFIPLEYKFNKSINRIQLLSGILSENSIIENDFVYIYHPFKSMCEDIQWIARSLGLTCKLKEKSDPRYGYTNEFCCIIYGPELAEITYQFSRQDVFKEKFKFHNYYRFQIKYLGEGEYYGLKIEDNSLFLTNQFDIV
jgi:hypothetical protein